MTSPGASGTTAPSRSEPDGSIARSAASGITFALANAAQRALAFLLLPVYTVVLSPAAYGRLGLLITLQSGAVLLLQAGMEASITRHYFTLRGRRDDQRAFIQSSWRFLGVLALTLATFAAVLLFALFDDSPVFRPGEAALALGAAATFVVATVVPLTVLRVEQRLRDYILMTAVLAGVTTFATLVAVVGLRLGVGGWFAAAIAANVAAFFAALRIVPAIRNSRFDRTGVRTALVLGVSLIPHAISLWALSLADRIVLATLVTPGELGVYTLAANLALPAMVVMQSLNQGFLPTYARAQHRDEATREELDRLATLQSVLILGVALTVAVLAAPVINLLNPAYVDAAEVAPWLVLGIGCWGFYQIPMNVISMIAGRTRHVWLLGLGSAAVGIGSLFAFVPTYGLNGAGVASVLGYFALFVFTTIYLRALREPFPGRRAQILLALVLTLGAYATVAQLPESGVVGFVTRSAGAFAAVATLAWLGGLRPAHLRRVMRGE